MENFKAIVEEIWKMQFEDHNMFQVVNKLKMLKFLLKKLAWKKGSLRERVDKCREDLKCAQLLRDKHPHDDSIKEKEAKYLSVYIEAIDDEESLMLQHAKSEWISKGDINTKFFHKIIKSRANVNRIFSICNEKGDRFEGEDATTQINNDGAELMVQEIADKEIKEAMFSIGENKAPWPDGLPPLSLKAHGILLARIGYNCKNGPKRCALKIDIAKAYDTVIWCFLENVLINFGFHMKMVKWIMTCVSTIEFTIGVNGERHGYFRHGRGLRQGDLISPYLFTIVMEILCGNSVYGLLPNIDESTIFFGSINELIASILSAMQAYWVSAVKIPK
nr:RNA-directed DNA polymerase, eukaryota, reverse transcriptase zinc-binding domain protein [Tanacetum cinerariifolium]